MNEKPTHPSHAHDISLSKRGSSKSPQDTPTYDPSSSSIPSLRNHPSTVKTFGSSSIHPRSSIDQDDDPKPQSLAGDDAVDQSGDQHDTGNRDGNTVKSRPIDGDNDGNSDTPYAPKPIIHQRGMNVHRGSRRRMNSMKSNPIAPEVQEMSLNTHSHHTYVDGSMGNDVGGGRLDNPPPPRRDTLDGTRTPHSPINHGDKVGDDEGVDHGDEDALPLPHHRQQQQPLPGEQQHVQSLSPSPSPPPPPPPPQSPSIIGSIRSTISIRLTRWTWLTGIPFLVAMGILSICIAVLYRSRSGMLTPSQSTVWGAMKVLSFFGFLWLRILALLSIPMMVLNIISAISYFSQVGPFHKHLSSIFIYFFIILCLIVLLSTASYFLFIEKYVPTFNSMSLLTDWFQYPYAYHNHPLYKNNPYPPPVIPDGGDGGGSQFFHRANISLLKVSLQVQSLFWELTPTNVVVPLLTDNILGTVVLSIILVMAIMLSRKQFTSSHHHHRLLQQQYQHQQHQRQQKKRRRDSANQTTMATVPASPLLPPPLSPLQSPDGHGDPDGTHAAGNGMDGAVQRHTPSSLRHSRSLRRGGGMNTHPSNTSSHHQDNGRRNRPPPNTNTAMSEMDYPMVTRPPHPNANSTLRHIQTYTHSIMAADPISHDATMSSIAPYEQDTGLFSDDDDDDDGMDNDNDTHLNTTQSVMKSFHHPSRLATAALPLATTTTTPATATTMAALSSPPDTSPLSPHHGLPQSHLNAHNPRMFSQRHHSSAAIGGGGGGGGLVRYASPRRAFPITAPPLTTMSKAIPPPALSFRPTHTSLSDQYTILINKIYLKLLWLLPYAMFSLIFPKLCQLPIIPLLNFIALYMAYLCSLLCAYMLVVLPVLCFACTFGQVNPYRVLYNFRSLIWPCLTTETHNHPRLISLLIRHCFTFYPNIQPSIVTFIIPLTKRLNVDYALTLVITMAFIARSLSITLSHIEFITSLILSLIITITLPSIPYLNITRLVILATHHAVPLGGVFMLFILLNIAIQPLTSLIHLLSTLYCCIIANYHHTRKISKNNDDAKRASQETDTAVGMISPTRRYHHYTSGHGVTNPNPMDDQHHLVNDPVYSMYPRDIARRHSLEVNPTTPSQLASLPQQPLPHPHHPGSDQPTESKFLRHLRFRVRAASFQQRRIHKYDQMIRTYYSYKMSTQSTVPSPFISHFLAKSMMAQSATTGIPMTTIPLPPKHSDTAQYPSTITMTTSAATMPSPQTGRGDVGFTPTAAATTTSHDPIMAICSSQQLALCNAYERQFIKNSYWIYRGLPQQEQRRLSRMLPYKSLLADASITAGSGANGAGWKSLLQSISRKGGGGSTSARHDTSTAGDDGDDGEHPRSKGSRTKKSRIWDTLLSQSVHHPIASRAGGGSAPPITGGAGRGGTNGVHDRRDDELSHLQSMVRDQASRELASLLLPAVSSLSQGDQRQQHHHHDHHHLQEHSLAECTGNKCPQHFSDHFFSDSHPQMDGNGDEHGFEHTHPHGHPAPSIAVGVGGSTDLRADSNDLNTHLSDKHCHDDMLYDNDDDHMDSQADTEAIIRRFFTDELCQQICDEVNANPNTYPHLFELRDITTCHSPSTTTTTTTAPTPATLLTPSHLRSLDPLLLASSMFTMPVIETLPKRPHTILDFSPLRVVGQGSYGKIVLAEHVYSKTRYALKITHCNPQQQQTQLGRQRIHEMITSPSPALFKARFPDHCCQLVNDHDVIDAVRGGGDDTPQQLHAQSQTPYQHNVFPRRVLQNTTNTTTTATMSTPMTTTATPTATTTPTIHANGVHAPPPPPPPVNHQWHHQNSYSTIPAPVSMDPRYTNTSPTSRYRPLLDPLQYYHPRQYFNPNTIPTPTMDYLDRISIPHEYITQQHPSINGKLSFIHAITEKEVLECVDHPNIMTLYGSIYTYNDQRLGIQPSLAITAPPSSVVDLVLSIGVGSGLHSYDDDDDKPNTNINSGDAVHNQQPTHPHPREHRVSSISTTLPHPALPASPPSLLQLASQNFTPNNPSTTINNPHSTANYYGGSNYTPVIAPRSGLLSSAYTPHHHHHNHQQQQQNHQHLQHYPYHQYIPPHLHVDPSLSLSMSEIILVEEFFSHGDLYTQLSRHGPLSIEALQNICVQSALALDYLHRRGILYRDLKPENILLVDCTFPQIVLTDFGLSKICNVHPGNAGSGGGGGGGDDDHNDDDHRNDGMDRDHIYTHETHEGYKVLSSSTIVGTPEYMSPELLSKGHYTYSTDYYSLGVVLFELATGQPPFYHQDTRKLHLKTVYDPVVMPNFLHPLLQSLLHELLHKDGHNRLQSVSQLQSHPFLAFVDWNGVLSQCESHLCYRDAQNAQQQQQYQGRARHGQAQSTMMNMMIMMMAASGAPQLPRRHVHGLLGNTGGSDGGRSKDQRGKYDSDTRMHGNSIKDAGNNSNNNNNNNNSDNQRVDQEEQQAYPEEEVELTNMAVTSSQYVDVQQQRQPQSQPPLIGPLRQGQTKHHQQQQQQQQQHRNRQQSISSSPPPPPPQPTQTISPLFISGFDNSNGTYVSHSSIIHSVQLFAIHIQQLKLLHVLKAFNILTLQDEVDSLHLQLAQQQQQQQQPSSSTAPLSQPSHGTPLHHTSASGEGQNTTTTNTSSPLTSRLHSPPKLSSFCIPHLIQTLNTPGIAQQVYNPLTTQQHLYLLLLSIVLQCPCVMCKKLYHGDREGGHHHSSHLPSQQGSQESSDDPMLPSTSPSPSPPPRHNLMGPVLCHIDGVLYFPAPMQAYLSLFSPAQYTITKESLVSRDAPSPHVSIHYHGQDYINQRLHGGGVHGKTTTSLYHHHHHHSHTHQQHHQQHQQLHRYKTPYEQRRLFDSDKCRLLLSPRVDTDYFDDIFVHIEQWLGYPPFEPMTTLLPLLSTWGLSETSATVMDDDHKDPINTGCDRHDNCTLHQQSSYCPFPDGLGGLPSTLHNAPLQLQDMMIRIHHNTSLYSLVLFTSSLSPLLFSRGIMSDTHRSGDSGDNDNSGDEHGDHDDDHGVITRLKQQQEAIEMIQINMASPKQVLFTCFDVYSIYLSQFIVIYLNLLGIPLDPLPAIPTIQDMVMVLSPQGNAQQPSYTQDTPATPTAAPHTGPIPPTSPHATHQIDHGHGVDMDIPQYDEGNLSLAHPPQHQSSHVVDILTQPALEIGDRHDETEPFSPPVDMTYHVNMDEPITNITTPATPTTPPTPYTEHAVDNNKNGSPTDMAPTLPPPNTTGMPPSPTGQPVTTPSGLHLEVLEQKLQFQEQQIQQQQLYIQNIHAILQQHQQLLLQQQQQQQQPFQAPANPPPQPQHQHHHHHQQQPLPQQPRYRHPSTLTTSSSTLKTSGSLSSCPICLYPNPRGTDECIMCQMKLNYES